MEKRKLGNSGLEIAPLMFGGNVLGWTADEATSFKLLDRFVDAGLNAIDTADVYSTWVPGHKGGESETVIGTWLKARGGRDKVVIATKVGWDMGHGEGPVQGHILQASRIRSSACRPTTSTSTSPTSTIRKRRSRRRWRRLRKLIEQGKVRAIGASNYTAPRLAEALKSARRSGCRATRACSRTTTSMSARASRPRWSRCA